MTTFVPWMLDACNAARADGPCCDVCPCKVAEMLCQIIDSGPTLAAADVGGGEQGGRLHRERMHDGLVDFPEGQGSARHPAGGVHAAGHHV